MDEIIKLKDGNTLEVYQDMSPYSPREWDNLGTMICFHKRYSLGDDHDITHDNYSSWDEMIEENTSTDDLVLPLYLYDHGAITISTTPFSCRWDSGQVGYITISKEKIIYEYDNDSAETRARVLTYLKNEVKTYDQYLTGEVYGFILKDENDEEIDSCWGFYGDNLKESGILDSAGYKMEDVA